MRVTRVMSYHVREVAEEDVTNDTTVTKKTKSDSNAEVTQTSFRRGLQ